MNGKSFEKTCFSYSVMARRSMARRSMARRSMARRSMARRSMARRSMARRSLARKSMARRSMARRSMARRSMARRSMARRSMARRSMARRSMARRNMARRNMSSRNCCHLSIKSVYVKPLLPEFFFSSVFKRHPKMSSYRIPTHRCGVHRIFFIMPSYFKIEISAIHALLWPICNKGWRRIAILIMMNKWVSN